MATVTSLKVRARNNNTKVAFEEEKVKSPLFQGLTHLPLLTEILSCSVGSLSFYKQVQEAADTIIIENFWKRANEN